ncbi:MAG: alkaline phosphatase family protein [Rhizobiaceae bacterium]
MPKLLMILFLASATFASMASASKAAPRLILQITVDGLRGDLLRRYGDRFGEGGFRYLLENGVVYTNAHYSHANTETIVGHTTLATGAHPSEHGMVGNVIFDRANGELAYNIEDIRSPLIPTRQDAQKGDQVDPAQKRSRSAGRSPRNISASTIADELSVFHAGKSKVFGVSGKDRSAVAMAGHSGKAFWLSTDTGDFQTSEFYYDDYPDWVVEWNSKRKAEQYSGKSWELENDINTYLLGNRDNRPYETDLGGYGRTFPHPFGSAEDKLFNTRILVSPVGDQLTADFAMAIIDNENLGQDTITDYLSVSFSGVDAVNHFFGPSSLENEEIVLQLDKTLARLFDHVDVKIGLENTVIVLSADHGMPEAPEFMAELGMNVGRIDPDTITNEAKRVSKEVFGKEDLVLVFFRPYLYLNSKAIKEARLKQEQVEAVIADAITNLKGIAHAVSTMALSTLQNTPVVEKIRRNTHTQRSGDIYVVQEPYWFLQEGGTLAVMHGTPWAYDTYVPIIFAGGGIKPLTVDRLVHPVAVAPTLATLAGVKPPSSAFAATLVEVTQQVKN